MESVKQIYGLTVFRRCGGGAYGEVFQCLDASGKEVALKVIDKARVGSGWKRELKGITHYRKLAENMPGLLKLYHVGEDKETFYYTMELADALPGCAGYKADTLAARLEHGPLPTEQLIPTLTAILEGIRTLHEAGFAHRDIKPENILFVKGEPKLADLGLLSPLTGTMTQLAGTLDFLPPEERSGESPSDSRESRQRNDLYAFGKLIYCCVTGNDANEFPSAPTDLPLTLNNKLFFRLAIRLCEREPSRRLTSMTNLVSEMERTIFLCTHGENNWDKLKYTLSMIELWMYTFFTNTQKKVRQRWMVTCSLLSLPVTLCKWVIRNFTKSPEKENIELALALQTQKDIAQKTDFTKADFTFYDGRYSVAVPTDWQVFDHDALAETRLPDDVLAQRLHGLLMPKEVNGNVNTVVSLMVLSITAEQLSVLNDQKKIETLKPLFADDVEAISIRQYKNPRLNLDTILFVGEAQPSKAVVCYLYPQSDHTLCLNALIPQEKFDADMGKFLAITDSLSWRIQK